MSVEPQPATAALSEVESAGSRWEASPPVWLRLIAGVGAPALAGLLWYACWTWVGTWPTAPHGDTGFAWMPLVLAVAAIASFLGLGALIPRTLGSTVAAAGAVWLLAAGPLYLLVPSYGASEGFPSDALPLMLGALLLSSLPVLALLLWPLRWSYAAVGLAVVVAVGAGVGMQRVSAHEAEQQSQLEATDYQCDASDAALVDAVVHAIPGAYLDELPSPEMQSGDLCESMLVVTGEREPTASTTRAWLEAQGYAVTTRASDEAGMPRTVVVATASGRPTVSLWIDAMGEGQSSVLVAVGDEPLADP